MTFALLKYEFYFLHVALSPSIELPQEWRTKHNVVYAFVVGDAVHCVGETTRGMTSRFEGYRYDNPAPLDTDNRVKLAITRALSNDEEVSIWAGQPIASPSLPSSEVLSIPACKPLEEHLIHRIQPDLNVKRIFQPNTVP